MATRFGNAHVVLDADADAVQVGRHVVGIRIEDDVAVTADGCRVYTTAPRTVAEIEAVMEHLS